MMGTNEYNLKALDRLCNKLIENEYGCFEYLGAITDGGYGFFWFNGRNEYVHRVAWYLENGDIPNGLLVLHKCDNRCCANVEHLFLGTHQDNTLDMINKGRQVITCGEARSNLKETTVIALKRDLELGLDRKEVANKYGLTVANVKAINRGLSWRHV